MKKSSYGMLGKKHSKASKIKMSENNKGRTSQKLSVEEIQKRTETRRKNGWYKNREKTLKNMSQGSARAMKGRNHTLQTRLKMADSHLGSKNHNWKGGVYQPNNRVRKSLKYQLWRKEVLLRDNYTCQECGKRGGKIHADHIQPFALYPELRFELLNGRTLCVPCHRKTETWGYSKIYRTS